MKSSEARGIGIAAMHKLVRETIRKAKQFSVVSVMGKFTGYFSPVKIKMSGRDLRNVLDCPYCIYSDSDCQFNDGINRDSVQSDFGRPKSSLHQRGLLVDLASHLTFGYHPKPTYTTCQSASPSICLTQGNEAHMISECHICGSNKARIVTELKNGTMILQCMNCKNAFTYPLPPTINYENLDFQESANTSDDGALTSISMLPKEWSDSIRLQAEIISHVLPKQSDILEIGCGEGILLETIKGKGYNVFGIEPSKRASERARLRGIQVIQGYFSSATINRRYSGIVMSHVLEHQEKPMEFIAELKTKLVPGGILMLTQTNFEGFLPKVQRSRWYAWVPEHHFWHFSVSGLNFMLKKSGFELMALDYCTLVHKHNLLFKLSQLKKTWSDQVIAVYRMEN